MDIPQDPLRWRLHSPCGSEWHLVLLSSHRHRLLSEGGGGGGTMLNIQGTMLSEGGGGGEHSRHHAV